MLHALADPVRLAIVRALFRKAAGVNCVDTMKTVQVVMPKSTCSQHFQILRESGVVFSERRGVELINHLRRDDLEARFPGLLASVLAVHEREAAAHAPGSRGGGVTPALFAS